MLVIPMALIALAVFATANVQRNAALLSAREQAASQSMLTAMLDQETGARGFFQTGQRLFLTPWYQGASTFASSIAELRSLVAGDSALRQGITDQARGASAWHALTGAAILALERAGRAQSYAQAVQAKGAMDGFRAANTSFDATLGRKRAQSLSDATAVAVAVAVALAALLAGGGLLLTHRAARREKTRQDDQAEMRELMQASESQQQSHILLTRYVEKLLPRAGATVLSCNDRENRLEITAGARAPLRDANTEQLGSRSCMAVRLGHAYDRSPGDRRGLQACEVCGGIGGSTACEPLLVGGTTIGSVLVASAKPIAVSSRARLHECVAQASPILANQRNLATAERRAASDTLTGLPNRRAADEAFEAMAAQAARNESPLAAILLDLDHFKELNDQHGHESGDRALALVGSIVQSTVRLSDFAARFGGEEFLVLLPDTDRAAAMLVAEKLRSEIERAELEGIGDVTASLGVAVLPTDAREPSELLRKADRALYTAKESGRNRVHAFSSPGVAAVV